MLNIYPTVADRLGRKWIGIDIEKQAVQFLIDRLSNDGNT
jgi:DNA modification methylase